MNSDFDRLAGELETCLQAVVEAAFDRLRERSSPWLLESPFSREETLAFARESIRTQIRAFRRGVLPESCPEVDATAAMRVAEVGELRALFNGYWAAQISLWDAWLEVVESAEVEGAERRELLGRGSDFFYRYAGLLTNFVTDVYLRQLERSSASSEERRFQAIRAVLEGDPGGAGAAALRLNLDQHHLGLIAWGNGGEAAARQLAASLGRPLTLSGPVNRSWWGWISGSRPLDLAEERSLRNFRVPGQAGLALGLQAFGVEGFRATHRQAQRARWANHCGAPLVRYADVAVESLASENHEEAHAFVARELSGIDDDSPASLRIRETLAAYFEAQHNAASAAAKLGVHQQTVANRIRAIEERLGYSVGERRVELEVALRLRAALGEPEEG